MMMDLGQNKCIVVNLPTSDYKIPEQLSSKKDSNTTTSI